MSGAFLSQIIRRTAWCLGLALLCSIPLRAADPAEATITSPTGPITTRTNTAVAFTATSTDSVGYDSYVVNSYAWTFGDGTTGASENTSHAYTAAGTYTVTLSVHYTVKICTTTDPDTGNCLAYRGVAKVATATRTITVLPPPTISSFSASSSSVEVGKPVTLSWATTNATSWSISGVGAVTGTSVSVSPAATTQYTLTATGGGGVATASVTVSTYTLSVTISPGSASLLLGGSQAFTGAVAPANQGLSWSATGGSMSGSTFTATASGTFTVKVASVEDSTKTASATVTVAMVSVATPVPVPATHQCYVGGTVSYTAQVAGAVNTGVTWSVNGGGSISPTGVFTASAQGTYTVTATSQADPTKNATGTVTVMPLVVTVLPATSIVKSGQTGTLTASVTGPGSPSQGVTWSVVTAGGGTITTGGVYTAPSTSGDYVVKATSTQDPSCFGTTTIHVPGWTPVWKKDVFYVGAKEVAEVDNTGKTWVEFDDHLGSPRYEWDGTASPVLGTNLIAQKYAPFGEYLNDPTTQSKFEKGFTNHEQTDPSGLIYMQARFYAPMYGRFLSPDPARDQHFEQTQSWNIYSYVQNNPTMKVDPNGMQEAPAMIVNGVSYFRRDGGGYRALDSHGNVVAAKISGPGAMPRAASGRADDDSGSILTAMATFSGAKALVKLGSDLFEAIIGKEGTETVQRVMSNAELKATQDTGLVRGGREGTHYATDAANSDPLRAKQRLALPQTPEVKATLEVPKGEFSPPSKVQPANNMPGGGMERTATGKIPAKVIKVEKLK